ncbi:hypothetical protein KGMB02408_41860 [Bacteroides faecalis]|uniref:Uncharacterized protein n=1 Tax=Bacteroides faecalis TaxID=2447885 RepID=A0A401M0C3_9BACE|nr:hypothetical protein KGMB02408_41860 [Bacteroides faecalis]
MDRLNFLKCSLLSLVSPSLLFANEMTEKVIQPLDTENKDKSITPNKKVHYWNKNT